jgi:hypothetical protein
MEREVIILKRKGNLGQLKTNGDIYNQQNIDPNSEGQFSGETLSKDEPLLGVMMNLTPFWKGDRWAFDGQVSDLKRIAKSLGLTDSTGDIITVDETSLVNRFDPFFSHMFLWTSTKMVGSSKTLTNDSAIEEFYMRVYRDRSNVKQSNKVQSKFDTEGSKLEIISPKIEKETKAKNISKKVKLTTIFGGMSHERKKKIAAILDPPGYSDNYNDPEALDTLIYSYCIDGNEKMPGTKRLYSDMFLMFSDMDNTQLDVYTAVYSAIRKNLIRRSKTGYTLKAVPISGDSIITDELLINFYMHNDNLEKFDELLELLEEFA